ncbi:MAG: methyltransferase [Proteobacteria bacterium]|nr:MAG: methyltransferase [Pseudomonadota bacterium]
MTAGDGAVTTDGFLDGRLKLKQPRAGHRAGHDAILLAAATPARPGDRVVEFGAGVGAAGLALALRVGGLDLTLVEIDAGLARLAGDNAAANGLVARVVVADVAAEAEELARLGLGPDSADGMLMNPPFNPAARHRASRDPARRLAHEAPADTLDLWTHAARRMLRPGGRLTLIWRADGLAEVFAALARGFGSLTMLPVHPRAGEPAIRVLVSAVKGGRAPLALHPGLVLADADGRPAAHADAVLRGRQVLALAEI